MCKKNFNKIHLNPTLSLQFSNGFLFTFLHIYFYFVCDDVCHLEELNFFLSVITFSILLKIILYCSFIHHWMVNETKKNHKPLFYYRSSHLIPLYKKKTLYINSKMSCCCSMFFCYCSHIVSPCFEAISAQISLSLSLITY